jgi:hypothetical protein
MVALFLFFKGMMGALASLSYLVKYTCQPAVFAIVVTIKQVLYSKSSLLLKIISQNITSKFKWK